GEYRHRHARDRRVGGCRKRYRRHDNFIPGPYAKGFQGDLECRCSGRCRDCVPDALEFGEARRELGCLAVWRRISAPDARRKNILELGAFALVEQRPSRKRPVSHRLTAQQCQPRCHSAESTAPDGFTKAGPAVPLTKSSRLWDSHLSREPISRLPPSSTEENIRCTPNSATTLTSMLASSRCAGPRRATR